jgi:hypothetical protein
LGFDLVSQVFVVDKTQYVETPSTRLVDAKSTRTVTGPAAIPSVCWVVPDLLFVIDSGKHKLVQIVLALRLPRSLASGLDGRNRDCYQKTNDCEDDQDFDQRESFFNLVPWASSTGGSPDHSDATRLPHLGLTCSLFQ